MEIKRDYAGKVFYGLLFCIVLPLFLFWWASSLSVAIPINPSWKIFAIPVTVLGIFLVLESMWSLWKYGEGLPMNAYPPAKYVTKGSYRFFYHPIYVGACLLCIGTSLLLNSAAGLYVVTPVLIVLCYSLVIGYESSYLEKKFNRKTHQTIFGLPENSIETPSLKEKTGAFFSTLVIWLIYYEISLYVGAQVNSFDTMTEWEKVFLPVIELAEIPYLITYFFIAACPFVVRTKSELRNFLYNAWWIIAIGLFLHFTFPFYSTPREFEPKTILGDLILFERRLDGSSGAFPSFHVLWALLAALTLSKAFPRLKIVWWTTAIFISLSCITTGIHSILDVVAAIMVFILVVKRNSVWKKLNHICERIANSWSHVHLGSLRIINHSVYAGLAAFLGSLITAQLSMNSSAFLIVCFCSVIGSALWAQLVEGSPKLLRPFGYYGSLVGGTAGLLLSSYFFDVNFFTLIGIIALAAPWVQAVGRLRCLVQGCCHGKIADKSLGIIYRNEHSRVCQISNLKEKSLHNTQLYSIVANILIGIVLLRIWYGGASPAVITGFYFILSGAARFVEEEYRGEIQTKIIYGLRFYQWLSVVSIITGILISSIKTNQNIAFVFNFNTEVILTSLTAGITWAFAMGMDFPKSNIRFSRLTG